MSKEVFMMWWDSEEFMPDNPYQYGFIDDSMRWAWDGWSAAQRAKPCNTCANRGRTDGLSQELHCDHCVYQQTWRTSHYVRA